eukprot:TRINITY_DN8475_c0_g3_i3.p1 TRINITY_DN8475_c0_g3~~TRINITY_DN8475_c0_g3_i3.p1  ORF type:complete len:1118 (-),score=247.99 TRINITY_DN8475_c0_g3_i3:75-3428(-)
MLRSLVGSEMCIRDRVGTLPDSLSSITGLISLWAKRCSLSGSLPEMSAALSSISLVANSISGTIPSSISSMTGLDTLQLDSNLISGTIPDMIANTDLNDLSIPSNAISGTFPSLGSTKLGFVVLWQNSLSGTLPTSFSQLTSLRYMSLAQNSMSGTLPDLSQMPNLGYILVDRNSFLGTIPTLSSPSQISLMMMSANQLSGTLPLQFSELTAVKHLVLTNNQVSGTIPDQWQSTSLAVLSLGKNSLSGTLPDWSTLAGLRVIDMSSNFLSGSLRTLPVNITAASLAKNRISGTMLQALPSGVTALVMNDLRLSGTLPASLGDSVLQTLALARNYFVGKTDVLEGNWNLSTLLLNSNYLSCDMAGLENSTELAQGDFLDPIPQAASDAVSAAQQQFELAESSATTVSSFSNIALLFAGNPEMKTQAGYLPPSDPERSTRVDEIRQGRYSIFSGDGAFKQLVYLTTPLLLVLHAAAISVSLYCSNRRGASLRSYLCPTRPDPRKAAMLSRVCFALAVPMLVLAGIGVLLAILNGLTPSVFSEGGGCVSPVVHISVASVQTTTAYQWMFVTMDIVCLAVSRLAIRQVQKWNEEARIRRVHRSLSTLAAPSHDSTVQRLLHNWRANAGDRKPSGGRKAVFWLLHVPVIVVASLPAIGYVLAENVPAGSGWWYSVLGNPLVVALVKVGFNNAIVPKIAETLARFKYSTREQFPARSASAIPFFKTQVRSMLIVAVCTVLVAPMLAVLVLDEACLRYYLWFAPQLSDLLESWEIGGRGATAYRLQFCSRQLVVEFQIVWLSIVLVGALVQPSVKLVLALPRIRAMAFDTVSSAEAGNVKRLTSIWSTLVCCRTDEGSSAEDDEPDLFWATLEHCLELLKQITDLLTHTVTIMVFGVVAPSLLLLGPAIAWLNLCSVRWISAELGHQQDELRCSLATSQEELVLPHHHHHHHHDDHDDDKVDCGVEDCEVASKCWNKCWGWFGAEFGGRILVHPPIKMLNVVLHVGNTMVSLLVFLDLEFGVGPMVVYGSLHLAVLVSAALYPDPFFMAVAPQPQTPRHFNESSDNKPFVDFDLSDTSQSDKAVPTLKGSEFPGPDSDSKVHSFLEEGATTQPRRLPSIDQGRG